MSRLVTKMSAQDYADFAAAMDNGHSGWIIMNSFHQYLNYTQYGNNNDEIIVLTIGYDCFGYMKVLCDIVISNYNGRVLIEDKWIGTDSSLETIMHKLNQYCDNVNEKLALA